MANLWAPVPPRYSVGASALQQRPLEAGSWLRVGLNSRSTFRYKCPGGRRELRHLSGYLQRRIPKELRALYTRIRLPNGGSFTNLPPCCRQEVEKQVDRPLKTTLPESCSARPDQQEPKTMRNYETFDVEKVTLQSGITLSNARLAYQVHGKLNADKSNAIVYPTRFYGTHEDNQFLIGTDMALNPDRYFIVVPNLTGNGLSSSPSNTSPPHDRSGFPGVTILDNVRLQRRLLRERYGIDRVALVVGWSMAAQQAYHWAALFPDEVERIAPIAGSARTSPHNHVFLEGMKAALTADSAWKGGNYVDPPKTGLRAMGRGWAGWALSQAFYRQHLYRRMGSATVEEFLVEFWEELFLKRDANNMLAQIWTWQHSNISDNDTYMGNYEHALRSISAKAIVMPSETDLYFPPDDSAYEVKHMANAELRIIPSIWGHYAGGAANPDDVAFVNRALRELLAS